MERPVDPHALKSVEVSVLTDDSVTLTVTATDESGANYGKSYSDKNANGTIEDDEYDYKSLIPACYATVYYKLKADTSYTYVSSEQFTGEWHPSDRPNPSTNVTRNVPKNFTLSLPKAESEYDYIVFLTPNCVSSKTVDQLKADDNPYDAWTSSFKTKSFKPIKSVKLEAGATTATVKLDQVEYEWDYGVDGKYLYYYVRYRKDGGEWSWEEGYRYYQPVNKSRDKVAELTVTPETTYYYEVVARKTACSNPATEITEDELKNALKGDAFTFTTPKAIELGDITVEKKGIRQAVIKVPYKNAEPGKSQYINVFCKDSTGYKKIDSVSFRGSSGEIEFDCENLTPDATQECIVVVSDSHITDYDANATYPAKKEVPSFKTEAETREISAKAEVLNTSVDFTVDLKKSTDVDTTCLGIYTREKALEDKSFYEKAGKAYYGKTEGTWEVKGDFKANTAYQYVVILWNRYDGEDIPYKYDPSSEEQKKDIIKITDVAEFTTNAEGRSITEADVKVTPGFTSAKFEVPVAGNTDRRSSCVYVFWKEKTGGTYDNANKTYKVCPANRVDYVAELSTTSASGDAGSLKNNTAYECTIVLLENSESSCNASDLEKTGDALREAGIIAKITKDFTTLTEGRQILDPVIESNGSYGSYYSATITTGFTGGNANEKTYVTVFYKNESYSESYQQASAYSYGYSTDEAYEEKFSASDLVTGKQYDAVVVLSSRNIGSSYPVTSDELKPYVVAEKAFKIEIADSRKVTEPVAHPGYSSITLDFGYEGNQSYTSAYLGLYYKKAADTSYTYVGKYDESHYDDTYSYWYYDREAAFTDTIGSLEPGTSYNYAVVFATSSSFSSTMTAEKLNAIPTGWKATGSCETKKAALEPKAEYDSEGSDVGYSVLNVTASGTLEGSENSIYAELEIYKLKADGTLDTSVSGLPKVLLKNNGSGYGGAMIDNKGLLAPGTKYAVTAITLSIDNDVILTKEGTSESPKLYDFTTKSGETKVTVPDGSGELFLVLNNSATVTATVTPASAAKGAYNLLSYKVDPESTGNASIGFSANNRTGEINMTIYGQAAGDVTLKVISKADSDKSYAEAAALATFKVHVKDYKLAKIPAAEGDSVVPTSTLMLQKGIASDAYAVYETTATGHTKVDGAITVIEGAGSGIVSCESNKFTAKNVGKWSIDLMFGKYRIPVIVNATVPYTGFIVKELRNASYPGIITDGPSKEKITATVAAGKQYMIDGYLSPVNRILSDVPGELKFTATNTADGRVSVDAQGLITTAPSNEAYTAVVTVAAKDPGEGKEPWTKQTTEITLNVKPMPEIPEAMGCVLSNVVTKLGDVKFDEKYAGWSWDEAASTPLVDSAAKAGNDRYFTVSHDGLEGKYYPLSGQKVKLSVYTMMDLVAGGDADTILVLKDDKADATFTFSAAFLDDKTPKYTSLIGESQYQFAVECTDRKAQITPEKTSDDKAKVQFTKVGTYNFLAKVLTKSGDKVILSKKFAVKVVAPGQITKIESKSFTYNDESKTDVRDRLSSGIGSTSNSYSVAQKEEADKGVVLTVEAKDVDGNIVDHKTTKLVWKSSDTKVAKIKVDKKDSRVITITPGKEQGHAIITATAKDALGTTYSFTYRYQNKAPRVEKKSVSVNVAYDTDTLTGQRYAYNYGSWVEIVPVYTELVKFVKLYEKNGAAWSKTDTIAADFNIAWYSGNDYLVTAAATAKTGKNNLWLVATTESGSFAYPLTVTVAKKVPTVTAKVNGKINYFYVGRDDQAYITVAVSDKNIDYPTISWKDQSGTPYGFTVQSVTNTSVKKGNTWIPTYSITYPYVRVNGNKLADDKIVNGTLTVTLPGIRKDFGAVTEKTLKIPAVYKKPVLATEKATSNFVSKAKVYGNSFYIYNKTESKGKYKAGVYHYAGGAQSWQDLSTIETKTDDVVLSLSTDDSLTVRYTYSGSKKSEKIVMTVDSAYWREPLQVKHTIKDIAPKAVLTYSKITTNGTLDDLFVGRNFNNGNNNLYIYLKGNVAAPLTDVEIEGVGAAAQKLVEENLIEVSNNETTYNKAYLKFKQNALSALGGSLKKGTYKFKFTAHYEAADGTIQTLKPVTLSIKVVDKAMTAKTRVSGKLDIAKESFYGSKSNDAKWLGYTIQNMVKINTKFTNLPSCVDTKDEYQVEPVLKGQYADCFDLVQWNGGNWYIGFKGFGGEESRTENSIYYYGCYSHNQDLKAGMTIPLSIDYKIYVMGTDESINPAGGAGDGIPDKHLAAVINGGTFNVKTTQSKPKVKITYNKGHDVLFAGANNERTLTMTAPVNCKIISVKGADKTDSVRVNWGSAGGAREISPTITFNSPNRAPASNAGKTVTIPCIVRVQGADGISQDVKVTVKVKVKR